MRFELGPVEGDERGPVEALGHDAGQAEVVLLVGHLEEQQVGELLDVVAVGQAIVAQDVAVVPELVDKHLGVGHTDFFFLVDFFLAGALGPDAIQQHRGGLRRRGPAGRAGRRTRQRAPLGAKDVCSKGLPTSDPQRHLV